MKWMIITLCVLLSAGSMLAGDEIKTREFKYSIGEMRMHGYLAHPSDRTGALPGILVVHEWMGLTEHARQSAEKLANMGYVALAVDMYGEGKVASGTEEARKWSGELKAGDREEMRRRIRGALDAFKALELTDPERIGAMGYCFGGTVVLELARSGAALDGVVSFHGGLDTNRPEDAKNIQAAVLVLHGGDDPYVPEKDVTAFKEEMRIGDVDWQFVSFGGAVHSFTNPGAGDDPSRGAAYNERADTRSWKYMTLFFHEILKGGDGK